MIKNLVIFGDSYSTHKDYIPKGNNFYYCTGGRNPNEPVTNMLPEETWWKQLVDNTDANLLLNESWSGSTIGFTGYGGDSSSTSFIKRYEDVLASGFFNENTVDTIMVFGGTNDSWSNAPLGKEKYSDFSRNDLFYALPAICYFLTTLKKNHERARIVFILNCGLKKEIEVCVKNATSRLNIELVELNDIHKLNNHPTILGMNQIYEQVVSKIN